MIVSADSQVIHKRFTGDSENDLKINIFLAAVESAVDVDADTDVVFKDPALLISINYIFLLISLTLFSIYLYYNLKGCATYVCYNTCSLIKGILPQSPSKEKVL